MVCVCAYVRACVPSGDQYARVHVVMQTRGYTAVDFVDWAEKRGKEGTRTDRGEITAMVRDRATHIIQGTWASHTMPT